MNDPRTDWLANPVDLHYKGQLFELGVRVTDAMELEQQRNSQYGMNRPEHTCHLGPSCDDYECGHSSCELINNEQCLACHIESIESPAGDYCWTNKMHGWQLVLESGSNSGFMGEGVSWAALSCGCTNFDAGEVHF
jgi:hypothetical protein